MCTICSPQYLELKIHLRSILCNDSTCSCNQCRLVNGVHRGRPNDGLCKDWPDWKGYQTVWIQTLWTIAIRNYLCSQKGLNWAEMKCWCLLILFFFLTFFFLPSSWLGRAKAALATCSERWDSITAALMHLFWPSVKLSVAHTRKFQGCFLCPFGYMLRWRYTRKVLQTRVEHSLVCASALIREFLVCGCREEELKPLGAAQWGVHHANGVSIR